MVCSCLVLVGAYQWLVCYLLKESAMKLRQELANGKVLCVSEKFLCYILQGLGFVRIANY